MSTRLSVILAVVTIASPSVSIAATAANSCERVIRTYKQAVDWQERGLLEEVVWNDGYTQWPSQDRRPWSSVQPSGPHPKYRTYIRDFRWLERGPTEEVIATKEITLRVDTDGGYTGDYMVTKVRYTCLRRRGRWRIFGHEVQSREDLRNSSGEGFFLP